MSVKIFHQCIFTCQLSACELQPFSCHDLANDIYLQTAKTVFSHLSYVHLRRAEESCYMTQVVVCRLDGARKGFTLNVVAWEFLYKSVMEKMRFGSLFSTLQIFR